MTNKGTATIVVERDTEMLGPWQLLEVFIDAQLVGRLGRRETQEFPAQPGFHAVTAKLAHCWTKPIFLNLLTGDRVELNCKSNQPNFHPWHIHAFWFIVFVACLGKVFELFIPRAARFMEDNLLVETVIVLCLGVVGMSIAVWKGLVGRGWYPAIFFTGEPNVPDAARSAFLKP